MLVSLLVKSKASPMPALILDIFSCTPFTVEVLDLRKLSVAFNIAESYIDLGNDKDMKALLRHVFDIFEDRTALRKFGEMEL